MTQRERLYKKNLETPLGPMIAVASENKLKLLEFTTRKKLKEKLSTLEKEASEKIQEKSNHPLLENLEKELQEYMLGERSSFSSPLEPARGTSFQERVWEELKKIPYGETISYKTLAKRIGNEKAYRAVALANASNTLAILVPCHRVISSSGSLAGYAGGVEKKKKLLFLEKKGVRSIP